MVHLDNHGSCACCGNSLSRDPSGQCGCVCCSASTRDQALAAHLLACALLDGSVGTSIGDLITKIPLFRAAYSGAEGPFCQTMACMEQFIYLDVRLQDSEGESPVQSWDMETGILSLAEESLDAVVLTDEGRWISQNGSLIVLRETKRVLKNAGVLLFSASGADMRIQVREQLRLLGFHMVNGVDGDGAGYVVVARKDTLHNSEERFSPDLGGEIAYEHFHRYAIATRIAGGRRVLDVGCGEGYGTASLTQTSDHVCGIDKSLDVIERAKRIYSDLNVNFLVGDATALPVPTGSIDLVVCFEVIEHVPDAHQVLAELDRVLSDSGVAILSTPNATGPKGACHHPNPFHSTEYTPEAFRRLLEHHFSAVTVCGMTAGPASLCLHLPARSDAVIPLRYISDESSNGSESPAFLYAICGRGEDAVRGAERMSLSVYRNGRLAELSDQNERIAEMRQREINQATEVIGLKDGQIADARNAIRDKDHQIDAARMAIQRKDEDIERVALGIAAQQAEITSLKNAFITKDAEAATLRRELIGEQEKRASLGDELLMQRRRFGELLSASDHLHWSMDTPARMRTSSGTVTLSGWLFHESEPVSELCVRVGEILAATHYGLSRPDVRAHFGEHGNAMSSGFTAQCTLPPGKHRIRFELLTNDGYPIFHDTGEFLVVRRRLRFLPRLRAAEKACGLTLGLIRDGTRYLRYYRRLPPVAGVIRYLRTLHSNSLLSRQGSSVCGPGAPQRSEDAAYMEWVKLNRFSTHDRQLLETSLASLDYAPTFSVIMPVYRPPVQLLREAVESVAEQVYEKWELCICADGRQTSEVDELLRCLCATDNRIRVASLSQQSGISASTNAAAEVAQGEWLVFLDQDDLLTPDALAEFALHVATNRDVDIVYSDNDKIAPNGRLFAPEFKPDWSPELLLSYMFMGHAFALKTELFRRIGGLRPRFDGSQDFDLALRVTEISDHVGHIPRVLYHWRAHSGSTAVTGKAKPKSIGAGQLAVADALVRRGVRCEGVVQPEWAADIGVGIFTHEFSDSGPEVTILIPTRNNHACLRRCIESLKLTAYSDFHVLVLDDQSDDPDSVAYMSSLHGGQFRLLRVPRRHDAFNFSALVNSGVENAQTEYVLLLNDDTEVTDARWLSRMVGYGEIDRVGAVGAKLLYPDGRVQHAGVLLGMDDGLAGHAFKLHSDCDNGYLSYAAVVRNYSAVTAACMLTRKSLWQQVGGFDEQHFGVAYNDVDYCMRLATVGYRSVYVPETKLTHHEGASRGRGRIDSVGEEARFRQRVRRHGADRYYSHSLSLVSPFQIEPRKMLRGKTWRANVLAVTPWLNLTGAPLQQWTVVRELYRRGRIECSVWSTDHGVLADLYLKDGIQAKTIANPLHRCSNAREFDQITRSLGDELVAAGVDVVFATTLDAFYIVAAAEKAGIPCIWSIHESVDYRTYFAHLPWHLQQAVAECFESPYRVVFVSHATEQMFADLNKRMNFEVIRNGIDPRQIRRWRQMWPREKARTHLGIKVQDRVAVSVGTVCDRKAQHEFVEAIGCMDQDVCNASIFLIVGDRPSLYSTKLRMKVDALPKDRRDRVRLVAETDEVAAYYAAADAFVCTSRIESYPLTILEAMHMGLPVLTTPVFGISEQVRDGVNGLHYQPGDVGGLASKLTRLLSDADLRTTLASGAKYMCRRLENYQDMLAAYDRTISEASEICGGIEEEEDR